MVGGKGLLLALFIDGVTLAVVGYYIGGDEGYSMAVIGTMMFIFSVILHLLAQRKS